jgi:hypothetical protein
MKIFVITLSMSITLCSLTSCEHTQVTTVICFVDFSSSRDSAVINWYRETIKTNLLRNLSQTARLIVLPVDYNSMTSSRELFKTDFSKNEYHNEFAGLQSHEVERKNHQDSISAILPHFDLVFETESKKRMQLHAGTDIFGALKQCSKYTMPGQKTLVVIFSDMLQFTDKAKMNFEDHLNSTADIEQYLSSAEKIDLKNMQFIVLTGAQNDMKPEKFSVVKKFWEKYIAQCNGELVDYSSGAVSKLEESLTKED